MCDCANGRSTDFRFLAEARKGLEGHKRKGRRVVRFGSENDTIADTTTYNEKIRCTTKRKFHFFEARPGEGKIHILPYVL